MGDGDGGAILSRERGEGRPSYSGGEGRSGGECKRRGGSSTAFRQGKGKGAIPVERDQEHGVVNHTGDSEVVLRSQCTLRTLVGLNGRMTVTQREAVKATVLWPFLEYLELGMERHLTLSLIKCWVPREGRRRVPFSVYDVALFTGLPATGRVIELNGDEMSTEVGDMVRERMNEWEREEMVSRMPGRLGKKRHFFQNYVSAMVALCDENNTDDRVGVWVKIYAFSGVLFPCTLYGVGWGMLHYTENIKQMRQYNWAEVVWRVVVATIEDTQKKLCAGPLSEVQLNGLSLLIQVIPVLYPRDDEIVHPTVQDFMGTDEFGYYVDDGELSVDERLRRARDAYRSEKVAHESTKNELQMLRELVTNRKGEEDEQDVSSSTAVGAEEGVGGDGGPTLGDISTAAEMMDAMRGIGQQPVSRNEGAMCGVPGGVDRKEEVSWDLGREDGDGGMGLSGSGVDDREEVHMSAAHACAPGVSAKHESDRASNIVT
ncbi:LOW QUALITY PROTEIN: hypothetical protein Cgig2_014478 [Carnegiea gigantea]|uniref:Aminotransferase-like plant mobile domain-containing protein n=1 Tax=Carnegiea gigantea TaxID=171969 RepID=A0A9Q1JXV0_9CARY|nr:LOW QUALITY PROTEIN: hypothetical protein Cgig2_014478 [Carnegiea gigantea]